MEPTSNLDDALEFLIPRGFPTFDEFRKNPDKWRKRPDEILESADVSSISFKNQVKSQFYVWKDLYKCKTLEELERIIQAEGYQSSDLEMKPISRPVHGTQKGGQVEIEIQFWPKADIVAQGGRIIHG